MKEDYKIDFTGVEWAYSDIIKAVYLHINNVNRRLIEPFDNSDTTTGVYITYYNLHNRLPEIKNIQEMILQRATQPDVGHLGAIMLRKLIEK